MSRKSIAAAATWSQRTARSGPRLNFAERMQPLPRRRRHLTARSGSRPERKSAHSIQTMWTRLTYSTTRTQSATCSSNTDTSGRANQTATSHRNRRPAVSPSKTSARTGSACRAATWLLASARRRRISAGATPLTYTCSTATAATLRTQCGLMGRKSSRAATTSATASCKARASTITCSRMTSMTLTLSRRLRPQKCKRQWNFRSARRLSAPNATKYSGQVTPSQC